MSILVLGSNGMAGYYISTYLTEARHSVTEVKGRDLDIRKPDSILPYITNETRWVINCIGSIPHRKPSVGEMIAVNSVWPQILYIWLKENFSSCTMIHLTTDCVFHSSGENQTFDELEEVSAHSSYGLTKWHGEPLGCMTIRTSIIGEEQRNFLGIIEWVKSAKHIIPGWSDHFWNGITCLELAKILHTIVTKNIIWQGVRHIYSPEILTKCKLVVTIARRWNPEIKVLLSNSGQPTNRALSSIYSLVPLSISPIEVQLDELFQWGKNRFNRRQ